MIWPVRSYDKPIILQFAGNVKAGTVAEYGETGVGQKADIKKGVASLQEVEVPSTCRLMPYRTFTEVKQPMSSFIFRVKAVSYTHLDVYKRQAILKLFSRANIGQRKEAQ